MSPKRQAILQAAADLFVVQGYGAVSMDSIARAAGVSKATLYAHFESKDRLFATIITEACQCDLDSSDLVPGTEQEPRAALENFARRMLSFFLEERVLAIHRVVIAESARFPELGRAFYQAGPARVLGRVAAWLARQTEQGTMATADPARAAEQLLALVRADLFLRATLGLQPRPDPAAVAATARDAIALFMAGYGARAGSSHGSAVQTSDAAASGHHAPA